MYGMRTSFDVDTHGAREDRYKQKPKTTTLVRLHTVLSLEQLDEMRRGLAVKKQMKNLN